MPAPASELVPHRAFYRLSLATLGSDSEVSDVQGGIGYEISDGCDGWIVEQQYAMRILWSNGTETDSSDTFVSWESKDGLEYRFNAKKFRNGEQYKLINGRAELESKGGAGMARFDEPENSKIPLPAGTVFPTEHTIILLQEALNGKKFDRHMVFDGSDVEGASATSTVILNRKPAGDGGVLEAPLGPHPVWPMKLAFYAAEGQAGPGEELPEFELSMDIQENGIAASLVLIFDGFSLNGTLESIERLPDPRC
jgi:hypothetical protein